MVQTLQTALIDGLKQDITHIESQSIRMQASVFCDVLFEKLMKSGIDCPLPRMMAIAEPDEFYLEWMFDDRRFGFDFLEDGDRSGWFVLIRKEEGTFRFRSKFNREYHESVYSVIAMIMGV